MTDIGVEGVDFLVMTSRKSDGTEIKRRVPIAKDGLISVPEKSQTDLVEKSRVVAVETEATARAILENILETKKNGGKVIVEVGCGPKISISLGRRDFWIGVDPGVNKNLDRVDAGDNKIYKSSKRLFCKYTVSDLPDINPDLVVMVAPNPADITDKNLITEVAQKLMQGGARLLLVLDTQSYESILNPRTLKLDGDGLREVRKNIEQNFGLDDYEIELESWSEDKIDSETMDDLVGLKNPLHINSDFLQAQEKLVVVIRKR